MDREKVIAWLADEELYYREHGDAHNSLMACDALALLKEQDAEWIYGEDETGVDGWHCSECNFFEPWFSEFDENINFIKRYERCPKCGRRMISYTGKQEGGD